MLLCVPRNGRCKTLNCGMFFPLFQRCVFLGVVAQTRTDRMLWSIVEKLWVLLEIGGTLLDFRFGFFLFFSAIFRCRLTVRSAENFQSSYRCQKYVYTFEILKQGDWIRADSTAASFFGFWWSLFQYSFFLSIFPLGLYLFLFIWKFD